MISNEVNNKSLSVRPTRYGYGIWYVYTSYIFERTLTDHKTTEVDRHISDS